MLVGPGITNTLSLARICKQFHVTFDSAKELASIMHTKQGSMQFIQTKEGPFARERTPQHKAVAFVQTVEENPAKFSKAYQNAAITARKLLH